MNKKSIWYSVGSFGISLLVAICIYLYIVDNKQQNNTVYHFDGATIYWIE